MKRTTCKYCGARITCPNRERIDPLKDAHEKSCKQNFANRIKN